MGWGNGLFWAKINLKNNILKVKLKKKEKEKRVRLGSFLVPPLNQTNPISPNVEIP